MTEQEIADMHARLEGVLLDHWESCPVCQGKSRCEQFVRLLRGVKPLQIRNRG